MKNLRGSRGVLSGICREYVAAVHWFRRPPYLRWVVGALIVAVAFAAELRGDATVRHPFVATDLAPGDPVEPALEWKDVPAGMLPLPAVSGATAGRTIAAGEPLLPSHLGSGPVVPAGWWSVGLPLPAAAAPGTPVRVIVDDPPMGIDGVVTGTPTADAFGFEASGLVAVPGESADAIARAAGRGGVTVLIAP